MNKTVELVNEWGSFEARHPGAGIEDFCRYYLIAQREKDNRLPLEGGDAPWIPQGLLLKMIGRIHKLNAIFAAKALAGTGINQVEEFGMLITIQRLKDPKKTEVIYSNIFELSSGTDMLNRLKKRGFIAEFADKSDRRSKRIKLTQTGEKVIETCGRRMKKCATMMLSDLSEEDVNLCVQLMKNVEIKYAALWQQFKAASFQEIYQEAMKEKSK